MTDVVTASVVPVPKPERPDLWAVVYEGGRVRVRCSKEEQIEHLATVIARETGCDANADIVRRLVDYGDRGLTRNDDLMLQDIIRQARSALRRAGGTTNE